MDNKQKRDLQEVKNIREKYITAQKNTDDKLTRLKKLDESTKMPARIAALVIGVISTLIFGLGMCFILVWYEKSFVAGILIGILGLFGMASAYPVYVGITGKQREKVAPKVVKLADEIIAEETI